MESLRDRTGETLDRLLGGRLRLIQARAGYRCSVDAVLLASFARLRKGNRILDLGTGSGVVALLLALRHPGVEIVGVEIQPSLARRAERNVVLNGLQDRIHVVREDVRRLGRSLAPESFDGAVCNPPYWPVDAGRLNRNDEKTGARHEAMGTLRDFLRAAAFAVKQGGRTGVVYPAARLAELFQSLRAEGMEPKRLRVAHARPDGDGDLVLVEAVRGGGEGLRILPPLVLYGGDGAYGQEVSSWLRGATPAAGAAARRPGP